jgi:hypothetical protein
MNNYQEWKSAQNDERLAYSEWVSYINRPERVKSFEEFEAHEKWKQAQRKMLEARQNMFLPSIASL